jgi:hypothetical protein
VLFFSGSAKKHSAKREKTLGKEASLPSVFSYRQKSLFAKCFFSTLDKDLLYQVSKNYSVKKILN